MQDQWSFKAPICNEYNETIISKEMKGNMNKFMKHLSDDIVSENHKLKTQIIKTRKDLKSYQQMIVEQLSRLGNEMNLPMQQKGQEGFFFETPSDYLSYFINSLKQNVLISKKVQSRNKQLQTQIKDVRIQNSQKQSQLRQYEIRQQNRLQTISQLTNNYNQLQIKYTNNQSQYQKQRTRLKQEVFLLNDKLAKVDEEYKIKMLEQKQIILDKANQDVARIRVDMDTQLHQKEKAMKQQNDKRDKEIKSLLNTINSIIQKPSSSTTARNPSSSSTPLAHSQQTQKQLTILSQVIKPFTEHTNIIQKLSQARKQILTHKNEIRQLTSSLLVKTSKLQQKQNQNALLSTKLDKQRQRNQEIFQELEKIKVELVDSLKDKENMEKYYNQRWNTEINKVRHNMEKRYADREDQLESQYIKLRQSVTMERQQIIEQNARVQQQSAQTREINKNLILQITLTKSQQQSMVTTIWLLEQQLRQTQQMHKQEIRSTKLQFQVKQQSYSNTINMKNTQIEALIQKQQQSEQQFTIRLNKINKDRQLQHDKQISQIKAYYQGIVDQKVSIIDNFQTQIHSHKDTIAFLQKEEGEKIQDLKKKISKDRERQIRDIKVAHYEEIGKLNEKILKCQQKIKHLKQEHVKNHIDHSNTLNQKQKAIEQLKKILSTCETTNKYLQQQQKRLLKQIDKLKSIIIALEQRISSLRVQINSKNLIISNKDKEIFVLIDKRNNWKQDVDVCRKQFQKGFKQLTQIHSKKIQHYRSRIWELQRICEIKGISKKDYEKIRSLTEQKKKLKQEVTMKEAQNLILTQVKNYYETKTKQLDSKVIIDYQLKNQKYPVFIRKPKRSITQIHHMKTQVVEDLSSFTGREAVHVKQFNKESKGNDRSLGRLPTSEHTQYKPKSRAISRSNARVNSSLM